MMMQDDTGWCPPVYPDLPKVHCVQIPGQGLGSALTELIIAQYSFCFVSSRRSESRG